MLHTHTHTLVSTVTSSQPLLNSGFNVGRSLLLDSRTIPMPQLPAPNSNSSQGLNRSSPLPDHKSTHFTQLNWTVKVKLTLRLAVYRQSIRLGARPLEAHNQRFFFQLNSCGNSPYVTSSLARWVCLLWIRLAFRLELNWTRSVEWYRIEADHIENAASNSTFHCGVRASA
jgi:hypothetical protein